MQFSPVVTDLLRPRPCRATEHKRMNTRIVLCKKEIAKNAIDSFKRRIFKAREKNSVNYKEQIVPQTVTKMNEKIVIQNKVAVMVNQAHANGRGFTERLRQMRKLVDGQKAHADKKKQDVEELIKYYVEFHGSIVEVYTVIEQLEEELDALNGKECEFKEAKSNSEDLKAVIQKTNLSISATEHAIKQLDRDNGKLQKEVDGLNLNITEITSKIESQQTEKTKIENELMDIDLETVAEAKMADIESVFENHKQSLIDLQAEHKDRLVILDHDLKEAIERNETLAKALDDVDATLTVQRQELKDAKEKAAGSQHYGAGDSNYNLKLEEERCRMNQVEEELMLLMNQVNGKEDVLSVVSLDHESVKAKTDTLMNTRRTSTPHVHSKEIFNMSFMSLPSTSFQTPKITNNARKRSSNDVSPQAIKKSPRLANKKLTQQVLNSAH